MSHNAPILDLCQAIINTWLVAKLSIGNVIFLVVGWKMKLLRMVEEKVQNGWILELEHLQQYEHRDLYIRVELLTIKENPDWNLVVVSNSSKQQEREREKQ